MIELVGYIRVFSQHGRLVTAEQIAAVAGLEWDNKQTVAGYIQLILNEAYADVQMRLSDKRHFFYSDKSIVERYAEQWLALERGDAFEAIIAQIRRNSCRHTEVYQESVLTFAPYLYDEPQLANVREQLPQLGAEDIHYAVDKQGKGYYYSTQGLSHSYAAVLANYDPCEWSN
ncbi:hypothetical protein RJP56_04735 [Shewanella baltica]|uniref:hypothetical protein n=1 Tax=Shewanella baltica TaxID=62322 RepID=UPI002870E809|nr:hypothetical protein [Shewanella baltica]MDR9765362.1 hypothetical protein [Shewanella baltica]